jgi:hypothetical protein
MAKTKTIYKYHLNFNNQSRSCELLLPAISTIRHIDIQEKDGGIFLWAEVVTSEQPPKRRLFELYGTGWELEDRPNSHLLHLKTLLDGAYVWHIYERVYAPTEGLNDAN